MSLARVDLPAPVGPTRASRAPTGMARSTSREHGRAGRRRRSRRPRTSMSPRSGRSTAPGRSGTSTGVSRSPNSLLSGGAGRLHDVEQLGQLLDRLEEVREGEDEEGDGADRELTRVHPPAADADGDGGGEQAGQLDHREVPGRDLHRAHVGVEEAAVAALEAGGLDVLPAERLHDADAGDALLELRERVADAVAHVEVGGVRVALELDAGQHHERHADEAEQQELPRHDGEHDHRHHEEEAVADEHQQAHLHELLERVHVARHPGDDDRRPSRGRRTASTGAGGGRTPGAAGRGGTTRRCG